jgi:hypothetical protein
MYISDYTSVYNCTNCFHSHGSYTQEPVSGRSKGGVEVRTEDCGVFMSSVVCHAGPQPLFISKHNGDNFRTDVQYEPEYYLCGRGRWWKDGKWMTLIEIENSES